MLDSKDSKYIMEVYSIIQIVMNKLPDKFYVSFIREGVADNIYRLISTPTDDLFINIDSLTLEYIDLKLDFIDKKGLLKYDKDTVVEKTNNIKNDDNKSGLLNFKLSSDIEENDDSFSESNFNINNYNLDVNKYIPKYPKIKRLKQYYNYLENKIKSKNNDLEKDKTDKAKDKQALKDLLLKNKKTFEIIKKQKVASDTQKEEVTEVIDDFDLPPTNNATAESNVSNNKNNINDLNTIGNYFEDINADVDVDAKINNNQNIIIETEMNDEMNDEINDVIFDNYNTNINNVFNTEVKVNNVPPENPTPVNQDNLINKPLTFIANNISNEITNNNNLIINFNDKEKEIRNNIKDKFKDISSSKASADFNYYYQNKMLQMEKRQSAYSDLEKKDIYIKE